jgi:hypothetical protein
MIGEALRTEPKAPRLVMTLSVDKPSADSSPGPSSGETLGQPRSPTAAQLRRFIKSRPYVPLHELRRRFELNGELDDVTAIELRDGTRVYLGLPARESQLIADLARDGDVGLEMCHDPLTPMVVGLYPMRPVTRA